MKKRGERYRLGLIPCHTHIVSKSAFVTGEGGGGGGKEVGILRGEKSHIRPPNMRIRNLGMKSRDRDEHHRRHEGAEDVFHDHQQQIRPDEKKPVRPTPKAFRDGGLRLTLSSPL